MRFLIQGGGNDSEHWNAVYGRNTQSSTNSIYLSYRRKKASFIPQDR